MAKNILFNFIEQYLAKSNVVFTNCQRLIKDSNLEAHEYYRFELKNNSPTILKDEQHTYKLVSHHISVYQLEKRSNAALSQYHYTAYFIDEEGTEYQLHAYFNDKNKLTTAPIFSVRQDNGDFVKIAGKNLESEFINLASINSDPVIEAVKKRLTSQVQRLEKHYKKLEASASELSVSIKDNYAAYIKTLGEIVATAKLLTPLVNHDFYQSVSLLTRRMQHALIEGHNKQTKAIATPPSSSQTSKKTNKEKKGEKENTVSLPKRKATRRKAAIHSILETEITNLAKQFESLQLHAGDQETVITQLGELIAQLHGLSLLLEDKKNTASLRSLQALHKVHHQLYETGETLFRSLLMNGQFELASRLPAFYYLLNSCLEEALETRNHQLLSFILEHGDLSIHSQAVTVRGKSYSSAAQCCVSLHMVDCLAALIAQGVSITSGNGSSLPIAYTILATQTHPLRKALVSNSEQTFLSIQFYKQLITSVSLYLEKNGAQLKAEKHRIIEDELTSYQITIKGLMNAPSNALEKSLQMRTVQFSEKHNDDISRKVFIDPEVAELIKQLQEKQRELLRKLPRTMRREYNESRAKNLENLEKALEIYGEADNFEDRKRDSIAYLHRNLLLLEKQVELATLKEEMERYRHSPRGVPLMKEFFTLLPEVVELERLNGVATFAEEQVEEEAFTFASAAAHLASAQKHLEIAQTNMAAAQKSSAQAREEDESDESLTLQGGTGAQFRFFPRAVEKTEAAPKAPIVEEVSLSESNFQRS